MGKDIHRLACVSEHAELAEDISIGPFCVVGPGVKIDRGTKLLSHVSISGRTSIGPNCVLHPFVALGEPPQDLKFKGEDTALVIGANNRLRENVTMHLGTPTGRGATIVGNNGFFMAGSHVGHDCIVGDNVVFANAATLGGHVTVADNVIMGGLSAVHQLGRVGRGAFIGGGAPVTGDVIPYGMVDNHGRLHGLNIIGLKRRGASRTTIHTLRALYRLLFEGDGSFEERLSLAAASYASIPEARDIIDFIVGGERRPLCTPRPSR